MVTASLGGIAQIWQVDNGQLHHTLQDQSRTIGTIDFSLDGQRIVIASADGTARIMNKGY